MIQEYYPEFEKQFTYPFLNPKTVREFDEFLIKRNIGLEDAFQSINDYGDTLNVTSRTKRNYQTRLRRFIEYICEQKGVKIRGEVRITEGGQYDVQL